MTFTSTGGSGAGSTVVALVTILAFVLAPVVLGLALRAWDRRGRRTDLSAPGDDAADADAP